MHSSRPSVILVSHGSGLSETAQDAAIDHAAELRRRDRYDHVGLCFLSLTDKAPMLPSGAVYLVPLFMSGGYFVKTRIPELFGLEQGQRQEAQRQVFQCEALGTDPALADVVSAMVGEVVAAANCNRGEIHLLLVAHGSSKSPASREAARMQQRTLMARQEFADVSVAFLSEPPFLESWLREQPDTGAPLVIVGLFSADGPHAAIDVPEILHIWQKETGGRRFVCYLGAVGPRPEIADLIECSIARCAAREG